MRLLLEAACGRLHCRAGGDTAFTVGDVTDIELDMTHICTWGVDALPARTADDRFDTAPQYSWLTGTLERNGNDQTVYWLELGQSLMAVEIDGLPNAAERVTLRCPHDALYAFDTHL
ncbi:hypothetical protein [Zymobacter palmae]|nr:hypothetical protein [Zymobacter palmae]